MQVLVNAFGITDLQHIADPHSPLCGFASTYIPTQSTRCQACHQPHTCSKMMMTVGAMAASSWCKPSLPLEITHAVLWGLLNTCAHLAYHPGRYHLVITPRSISSGAQWSFETARGSGARPPGIWTQLRWSLESHDETPAYACPNSDIADHAAGPWALKAVPQESYITAFN